nr:hypothetical protein [Tanacetum cinerariifolium]
MTLTFAKTYNMIPYLLKSDASEGFNQIIDFLNGSSIKYALNIYMSCIKQFWSSVAMKKVNDIMRLQALVDKKKVIITEASIRDALFLDDADGIECLPNEEIFAELARIGYEKPSTKLTFYKAFFLSQWKFLIHTILQCMSAKRTSWNEFSLSMASAVICLSTGVNTLRCDEDRLELMELTVFLLLSDEKVGIERCSFLDDADGIECLPNEEIFAELARIGYEKPSTKLTFYKAFFLSQWKFLIHTILQCMSAKRTSWNEFSLSMASASPQEVADEGDAEVNVDDVSAVGVVAEGVVSAANDEVPTTIEKPSISSPTPPTPPPQPLQDQPSTSQGRIITDMDADKDVILEDAKEVVTYASATITADALTNVAAPQLTTVAVPTLTTAPSASRRRKGVSIRDLEESATPSTIIYSEAKSKDKGKEILAAKKQKLDEEVEELKRRLQIVPNDEDDVYIEATPLAHKVHVVDYEIYNKHNKPYFKIKRADVSHQLYLSFLSMLRNFDREELEALWRLVKERFATTKPKNFFDDNTWCHIITFTRTQLILLVERRYPLTSFTLDQMLNNVRLKVEKESEVSLELLSFGVDAAEEFKENMLSLTKTKRRITKESESLENPFTTKETPKGKTLTNGSKTGKTTSTKEPVKEPVAEVIMDDVGDDVVH